MLSGANMLWKGGTYEEIEGEMTEDESKDRQGGEMRRTF